MKALEKLQAMLDQPPADQPQTGQGGPLDRRLHDYQLRAVHHLWGHPRAGLFLEMGLGKTAIVLQALTPDRLPALVVAPKRVAEHVWHTEAAIWRPDLSVRVAKGSPSQREAALASGADVVVLGRDNLSSAPQGVYRTIVLDELSGFKNRSSKRWKTAAKLCQYAPQVWGLTGTPSPNGYMDLWAQAFLLDLGHRLEPTLTRYRSRYFTPGRQLPTGVIIEWRMLQGARERIDQNLSDICISMRSSDYLSLPAVTFNEVEISMPPKAAKAYSDMQTHLVTELGDQDHTAANAAVMAGKLSQITAGFLYPDPDQPDDQLQELHSEKLNAVTEIVEGTGSPVLVFYRFVHELDQLVKAFPESRLVTDPGAIEAWNRGEVPVLLAHPASAGHGLNLQKGGHTIVWTTLPWSLEEYSQANARLARQGQDHPVMVHHLMVPGSVDTRILGALQGKDTVQNALMDALKEELG